MTAGELDDRILLVPVEDTNIQNVSSLQMHLMSLRASQICLAQIYMLTYPFDDVAGESNADYEEEVCGSWLDGYEHYIPTSSNIWYFVPII